MNIDRCYCYDVPFEKLRELAEENGVQTIAELQDLEEFGQRCRLCHPYVREMLRTGKTAFHSIIEEENGPNR